jgi:hypothetical protein
LLKNKRDSRFSLTFIITLFIICALITPQVIAVVNFNSDNKTKNNDINQYEKEILDDEDIWFIKPVHEKIYIADIAEITFPVYSPVIFGPITIQVGCVYQNELISIRYNFKDIDGNPLGPEVQIHWSEDYPNFDYHYAKRHFPFTDLPSKFKIEAVGLLIGIPFAYQNITVIKMF